MRGLMIASAGLALVAAGAADAQQRIVQRGPGTSYGAPMMHGPMPTVRPMPNRPMQGHQMQTGPMQGHPTMQPVRGQRWGSKVGGRWWGGANAPGGWGGYRRPNRGWALPRYWVAPRFYINDWSGYGLSQPGTGYNWTRYYDDAVLVDARGSVYDSVSGLDWDRYDGQSGYGAQDYGYAGDDQVYAGPNDRGYAYDDGRGYQDRAPDRGPGRSYQQRDNGLGGAAVGAVVGGVAGNVIAGRGNRLGGTLIGAGVGAVAGYAIDKNEDRGRRAPPPPPPPRGYAPGYGAGYPQPGYGQPNYGHPGDYHHPAPVYGRAPGGAWVSPDGGTTVTTTTTGGGYGGGSTTIVVQSAPVVTTTTTTEYYDDVVSYSRPAKKVWKKRAWKPAPRCSCR